MASFRYALRDGARLIFRHWGLSFLTMFTSMAVFYLIGASVLFVMNVRNIVGAFEGELTIRAFVRADAKEESLAELRDEVVKMPHVTAARIITKEMALELLRKRMPDKAKALELIGENPLPAGLEIGVERASNVPAVVQNLKVVPMIQDVVAAGDTAERMAKFSRLASQFSLAMLIVAITASTVVLFNTIRIAVYSKEEEIGIMLMVGATPTFVALPFVIQGVMLGVIGSLGASVLLGVSYGAIITRLQELLPFMAFLSDAMLTPKLGLVLVGGGATVSLTASLLAVERFTRRAMKPL